MSSFLLITGVFFTAIEMDIHGPPGGGPKIEPLPDNVQTPPRLDGGVGDFLWPGFFNKRKPEGAAAVQAHEVPKKRLKQADGVGVNEGSLSSNGFASMAIVAGIYMLVASLVGIKATKTGYFPLKITFLVMMGTIMVYLIFFSVFIEINSGSLRFVIVTQLDILKSSGMYDMMRVIHDKYECCGSGKGVEDLATVRYFECTYEAACADKLIETFKNAKIICHAFFGIISAYILFLLILNCLPEIVSDANTFNTKVSGSLSDDDVSE